MQTCLRIQINELPDVVHCTVWVWLNFDITSFHRPIGFEQLWLVGWGQEEQWMELNRRMILSHSQWLPQETMMNEKNFRGITEKKIDNQSFCD